MEVYNEQLRDLLWEPKRDERGEKLPGQIEPIIEMRELNNVVQVSNVSFHSPETRKLNSSIILIPHPDAN